MGIIYNGDALQTLKQMPSESVQCCVTSPPYWGLRDYGVAGQLGLERTPTEFVDNLVKVFREVRRVLKNDGTLWLNLGDTYAGGGRGGIGEKSTLQGGQENQNQSRKTFRRDFPTTKRLHGLKPKDLVGIPWKVAFALRDDGWFLRSDIIWHKPNPMPESVTDRPTKAHEYLFLLSKSEKYFYDADSIKEAAVKGWAGSEFHKPETRNKRTVWTVSTKPFTGWTQTSRWELVGRDALCDGSLHIAFPSCPTYGGLFDLLTSVLCGAHEVDEWNNIGHTDCRLSFEPRRGYVPIGQLRAWHFGEQNLGSMVLEFLPSATRHNIENRKTDLYVLTNPSCKPSAERLARIEHMLIEHGWSVRDLDNLASNTWASDFDENQKPKTLWRKIHTLIPEEFSEALGVFYQLKTKKQSHFATFPPDLIEPCIKAGTRPGDVVLDPFLGSGTTGLVAQNLARDWIGIELNPAYCEIARERIGLDAHFQIGVGG